MEDPVDAVFVIRCSEDMGDKKFAASSHDHGVVSEVGMFEQDPSVFLVDTDCVFDRLACSSAVDEGGIHIVNCTLAVTAQCQAVGHVASSVLAEIEGVFAVVGMLWITIRNNHFGE